MAVDGARGPDCGVDNDGGTPPASRVWAAAGAAHVWAATAHRLAAWDAYAHAWQAKADAGSALYDSTVANGRVVDKDNRVGRMAIGLTIAENDRAADAMARAAVEFRLTSKLSKSTEDAWAMAADAYKMAGLDERVQVARDRARAARRLGQAADKWAARTDMVLHKFRRSSDRWAADMGKMRDGDEWVGDRADRARALAQMTEIAEYERDRPAELAKKYRDGTCVAAASHLRRAAAAAERAAESVRALLEDAQVREAADALRDAMAAARMAASGR